MYYNFDMYQIGSLIYPINQLGNNIKGAEIGVYHAQSSCTLLQRCLNIDTIYLVDPYLPYKDEISDKFIDEKEIEYAKLVAKHHVRYSGFKEKAVFIETNEQHAVESFDDESLDFVYLDAWSSLIDVIPQLNRWIPKVRKGGIIAGHDWDNPDLQQIMLEYKKTSNSNPLFNANNTWMWYK